MSKRSTRLPLVGEAGVDPEDADKHEEWLSLCHHPMGESVWGDTNILGLRSHIEGRHGPNATAILHCGYEMVLCLNPGIDWDPDELDHYLHGLENGHHYDYAGYQRELKLRVEDYWRDMSYPDRIDAVRGADCPVRLAFKEALPNDAVLDYLAEYIE